MARRTAPPDDLEHGGRQLWSACLKRDDTLTDPDNPMRHVLHQACRLADHLDALAATIARDGLMTTGRNGPRAHPALSQNRQGQALLARLLATLRLPDPDTSKRPQRRGGIRRNYGTAGTVTSLERARRRPSGPPLP